MDNREFQSSLEHGQQALERAAEVRRAALRQVFSAPGYYEELERAIACSDSGWIRAIVKKQFAQLHDPHGQARFLRGYGQLFPDISAEDAWYVERRPQIPILESAAPQEDQPDAVQPAAEAAGQRLESSNAFYRDGEVWVICREGEIYHFPDTVGFQYIWTLLRHPGQGLAAKQVLALCNAGTPESLAESDMYDDDLGGEETYQEQSDALAIRQYKARAREIEVELGKAKRQGEEPETARLMKELTDIEEHVEKDRARRGKVRPFANNDERARMTVTTGIRRARCEMQKRSHSLVNYFKEAISTGKECLFRDTQTTWQLDRPITPTPTQ